MKTLYIGQMMAAYYSATEGVREKNLDKCSVGDNYFVIGVEGQRDCTVEDMLKAYPEFQLVKNFPGVDNTNYLYGGERKNHHLIPSIIRRIK